MYLSWYVCFLYTLDGFLSLHLQESWTFQEIDREADISKLLQFFSECKANNKHFHWYVISEEDILCSGAMQARELTVYIDFGNVFTFDTAHSKTNRQHMQSSKTQSIEHLL